MGAAASAVIEASSGELQESGSTPAGDAAQNAALDLLNHFDSSGGATLIHTSDPTVMAFQSAWNGDGVASRYGTLAEDGDYGPLTRTALAAIVGDVASAVNYGGAPPPSPAPPAPTPVTPPAPAPPHPLVTPTPAPSGSGEGGMAVVLLLGVAGIAAYFLFFRKKKGGKTMIHLKTNPRGRRRNPSSLLLS